MPAQIDRDKLAAYLRNKDLNKRCSLCGRDSLTMIGDILYGLPLSRIRLDGGASSMPLVPIICAYCGNTLLINAVAQDLLMDPAEGQCNGQD